MTGRDASGPPTYTAQVRGLPRQTPRRTSSGGGGGAPPPAPAAAGGGGDPDKGGIGGPTTTPPVAGGGTTAPPSTTTVGGQTLQTVPTGPAKPKSLTPTQATASGFYTRTKTADAQLNQLLSSGYRPTVTDQIASEGGLAGNYVISDQGRQLAQIKRNFINAVLRRESGSAIQPSEFDSANQQYFPMPNDDEQTLALKATNRQQAIAALEAEAGKGQEGGKGGGKKWHYNTSGELVPDEAP